MKNAIHTLRIQNFKSIKDVTMQPRRINLIIGQPNVGKSNILEAMSLLGVGLYGYEKGFMNGVVRYEAISNLFYDDDISKKVSIESSISSAFLEKNDSINGDYQFVQASNGLYDFINIMWGVEREVNNREELTTQGLNTMTQGYLEKYSSEHTAYSYFGTTVQDSGECRDTQLSYSTSSILPKKYVYRTSQVHNKTFHHAFLEPPTGGNLLEVVQRHPLLRKEISKLFTPYRLNLVLRVNERKFEIQKQVDDLIYNYPYSSIADTLQRIIFYLAAIESNDDAVILLEEPEAHSYPVYVSMLGQRMVESRNNQFFVATHSPYLITEILEQMLPDEKQAQELAIFVAYYEDYQTKVKQLSDEEVRDIRADSVDVFYNMDRYIPRPLHG